MATDDHKGAVPDKAESVAELIQRIKLGTADPELLSKDQRQQCVEALYLESVAPSGIAQFLKVTDRTIRRDLADIRLKHALTPSHDLAKEIVGEYVQFARIHRGNLMKMARNSSATTAERAQAEYYAHSVGSDLIAKLQSLGYLPKSADSLVVMRSDEEHKISDRLAEMVIELNDMAELALKPEEAKTLEAMKREIENDATDNHDRPPEA